MIRATNSGCGWPWMRKLVRFIGVHIGDRSGAVSRGVMDIIIHSLSAMCSDLYWPLERVSDHITQQATSSSGKDSNYTSYIERFNNTLRQ